MQTINSDGRFIRTLKKTFVSLRNRNFRLFFIGQLVSNSGNWLTIVALTLLVLKITGSGFAVGLIAACQYGPIFFLSAWAGAIADRSNKRRLLLITQSLEMAQSIGLAILAFMPNPPMAGLYILAFCGGVVLAFDNPLRRSFVTEMVPKEDIPNAVALYTTLVNLSRVFGPALAGLLIITLGYGWCFTIDAGTYLVVLFCLFIMRTGELHRLLPNPETKGSVREGLRYIMSVPILRVNFVMLAAIGTLSYNFNISLPLFLIGSLHSSDGVYTVLYSIFSLGAVISTLVIARRSLVTIYHMIFGALALGLTMLILASVQSIAIAAPIIFLVGVASILYMTNATTIVQIEAKPEMHGRLLALQTVFTIGTNLIGGPLSGWLADSFGGRTPIIIGGLICLFAAGYGYVASRNK